MIRQLSYLSFAKAALLLILFISPSCKKEDPAPLATANFFVSNSGCASPCWVYFYDNSTNAVKWHWNFGNNFNSTLQNDSGYYNTPGSYDVELHVWNVDDVADSVTKTVMVY
jgi:PKD repeat protein